MSHVFERRVSAEHRRQFPLVGTNFILSGLHIVRVPRGYRLHLRRHQFSYAIKPGSHTAGDWAVGFHLMPNIPSNQTHISNGLTKLEEQLDRTQPLKTIFRNFEGIAQADATDLLMYDVSGDWDLRWPRGEKVHRLQPGAASEQGWAVMYSNSDDDQISVDFSSIYEIEYEWIGNSGSKAGYDNDFDDEVFQ